jgi:hypothetical protein
VRAPRLAVSRNVQMMKAASSAWRCVAVAVAVAMAVMVVAGRDVQAAESATTVVAAAAAPILCD